MKSIPIALDETKSKIMEQKFDQILTAKQDCPDADTLELEAEFDRLVYELYGLSEEEIAIVEGSVRE
jgi:hypothetical protein